MSTQHTVQLSGNAASEPHRLALISLPETWSIDTRDGKADVVVAATATEALAAMRNSAQVVVLTSPGRLTSGDVDALLSSPNDTIIATLFELAPRLAADPVIARANWSIVDSLAEVHAEEDLAVALLEQLTAVRLLVGPLANVIIKSRSVTHYVASATTDSGAMITLSGVATGLDRQQVSIDAISAATRLAVEVDLRATAHPAEITRFDAAGAHQSWPTHQSGLRLGWAALAAAMAGGGGFPWTLAGAAEDIQAVNRLLGAATHSREPSPA